MTINGQHLTPDAIAAKLARIETNIVRMIGFVADEVTAWRWPLGITLDRLDASAPTTCRGRGHQRPTRRAPDPAGRHSNA